MLAIKEKVGALQSMQYFIISIVIALLIGLFLIKFVTNSSSGDILKKQMLAKQVALLIDASQPGTVIKLSNNGFSVSLSNNHVIVGSKSDLTSYYYDFFTKDSVSIENKEKEIVIRIS